MKKQFTILLVLLLIKSFTSCDAVKRVSENEHLLTENTVLINDKKDNTETINNLLYQKPNRKILSIPLWLHIYNTARKNRDSLFEIWLDKKPKRRIRLTKGLSKKQLDKLKKSAIGFNNWLRKTGEAPVIVNEEKITKSIKRLQDYHINNGWFDVKATSDINKKRNKRAQITYNVKTGKAFIIDSISEQIKSPNIDSIYQKKIKKNALIISKAQYRTVNFEQERNRISNTLRNSGIYHFNQDYVTFEIDTVGTNKKVNVHIQIQDRAIRTQDSIRREPFKIYKIKDVNIITDYKYEDRNKPFQDSIRFEGYNLYSYGKMRFRPKAITDVIFITPNTIFKDIDRTRTYRHINELRTFKYPNISYLENPDNTLSDTIRLTPLKKFSLSFSTDVSRSDIQSFGISLNPSLLIRNIFRGAETFEISAIASIGSSVDGNKLNNDPFFDINEYGIDFKLTIPRLFSPFNTEKIIPKYMSPNTRISISTTSQTNIGLDKQTLSGVFSYNWQPNSKVTNRLDLFNVKYVRNINIGNYFKIYENSYKSLNQIALDINYPEELNIPEGANTFLNYALSTPTPNAISTTQLATINGINERKERLTENNLILSSSFSFTNDEQANIFDEDFSIFRFKLELAGNLLANASSLLGIKKDNNNRYQLFNVAYSQYIKTELDYIKHWDLGKKNVLAIRSFLGIAIPYGNSTSIPFSKSFFAGGPNDNRAWSAYSLGPGSSKTINEFNEANLKFSFSVEQRFNLFGSLNGALFVDTGNIWNILDDVENKYATFTSFNSLKDIAVGSGFGLRYDLGYFAFRFDIGFKTYDPFYQDKNRWFNDYNFANAVYNIGINYPF